MTQVRNPEHERFTLLPHILNGKTTAISCTVDRETGVSRHHEGPNTDPLWTPRTSLLLWYQEVQEGPLIGPSISRETPLFQTLECLKKLLVACSEYSCFMTIFLEHRWHISQCLDTCYHCFRYNVTCKSFLILFMILFFELVKEKYLKYLYAQ